MRIFVVVLVCFFMAACGPKEKSSPLFVATLKNQVAEAKTDLDKVNWLSQLALYYIEIDKGTSDSVMQEAYDLALKVQSANQQPIVLCYLLDAERQLMLYDYKDCIQKVDRLATEAGKLANANGFFDYEAFSYLYRAQASRYSGNFKEAIDFCAMAGNLAKNSKSDSLKLEFYSTRSQVSQSLRLLNDALDNGSEALKIAEKTENKNLKLEAYRRLAYLYEDIDSLKAVDNYTKFIDISKQQDNKEQLIWAYLGLSRHYSVKPEYRFKALEYLHEAQKLAAQIDHKNLITEVHFYMAEYYIKTGQPDSLYSYLEANKQAIGNYYSKNKLSGRLYHYYAWLNYKLGQYFQDKKELVKADERFNAVLKYTEACEKAYDGNVNDFRKSSIYFYYGVGNNYLYFLHKHDVDKAAYEDFDSVASKLSEYYTEATAYFGDAQSLYKDLNDPEDMSNVLKWREELELDSAAFYNDVFKGKITSSRKPVVDYAVRAWAVRRLYDSCDGVSQSYNNMKDRISILSRNDKDLAEIALDKKQHEDNIKIVGIVFALVVVFMALVVGGYLRVSLAVTRGINFFAFIFLFEFILLITEGRVHEWTHGEIVSSLLIKIALAAILVPLHHFLEEKVIHTIKERALARSI